MNHCLSKLLLRCKWAKDNLYFRNDIIPLNKAVSMTVFNNDLIWQGARGDGSLKSDVCPTFDDKGWRGDLHKSDVNDIALKGAGI